MVYESFGTQKSSVTFISKFDSSKRSISGQIRSNFQIQNFLPKDAYRIQFCLRIPKMLFIFKYDN